MNGRYGYSESGSGWQASTLPGFGLMPQRYSCIPGDTATFAPGFNQAGNYHVYIWKTVNANADNPGRGQSASGVRDHDDHDELRDWHVGLGRPRHA
jgi:hypothetical protein